MTKNEVIQFLEKPDLYEKIITLLKVVNQSKYSIPKEGIIAGGAVSNVIFSFLYNTKPIVNDIDLFVTNQEFRYLFPDIAKLKINREAHEYPTHLSSTYVIDTVIYEKNLNVISVKYKGSSSINSKDQTPNLLKSFDLNCCQAALSLSDKKIKYTDDFVEFLSSGIVSILNLVNPINTLLRYHKKCSTLSFTSNTETQHSLVSTLCKQPILLSSFLVKQSEVPSTYLKQENFTTPFNEYSYVMRKDIFQKYSEYHDQILKHFSAHEVVHEQLSSISSTVKPRNLEDLQATIKKIDDSSSDKKIDSVNINTLLETIFSKSNPLQETLSDKELSIIQKALAKTAVGFSRSSKRPQAIKSDPSDYIYFLPKTCLDYRDHQLKVEFKDLHPYIREYLESEDSISSRIKSKKVRYTPKQERRDCISLITDFTEYVKSMNLSSSVMRSEVLDI